MLKLAPATVQALVSLSSKLRGVERLLNGPRPFVASSGRKEISRLLNHTARTLSALACADALGARMAETREEIGCAEALVLYLYWRCNDRKIMLELRDLHEEIERFEDLLAC